MPISIFRTVSRTLAVMCVVIACVGSTGCQAAGIVAGSVAGPTRTRQLSAAYDGLQDARVAVLVSAPQVTLRGYPAAPAKVCRVVSRRLAEGVDGITLTDPGQIDVFQRENPHWPAIPPGRLLDRLAVDCIVMIDLAEYATHESGNTHVMRGVVIGRVGVSAADAPNPDVQVFSHVVESRYPPGRPLGVLEADPQTIELGMLDLFSRTVAQLFHEHEKEEAW